MKIKKIGAILAGAVMIGSAVASAWDPSEHTDFFINPDTGQPNAVIVVGANAAASDVTGAAWIAAQMGNMAYRTVETEIVATCEWTKNFEGNYMWITPGKKIGAWRYGYDPQHAILDTLYWNDANENGKVSPTDTFEWITIVPDNINATEMTEGFIRYGAWFHIGEPFKFLGKMYTPIAVEGDDIILGDKTQYLDHEAIGVGEYTFGDYTVDFQDISVMGNKAVIEVTRPDGKTVHKILRGGQSIEIPARYIYDGNVYDYTAFGLTVHSIFLGVNTQQAIVSVETTSNLGVIDTPVYCLQTEYGYWNLELEDHTGDYRNTYELQLYGIQPTGYYGFPMFPNMNFRVPEFDPTEVESLDYVSGDYFDVTFDSHIDRDALPDVVWILDKITVSQRSGQYTEEQIPVEITPMDWIINDDEVTIAHKLNYNLILVGGPGMVLQPNGEELPANTLTKEIVEQGLSEIDWYTSTGDYEYIEDVYSDKDVLIVAGADRAATRKAVQDLLLALKS